MTIQKKPNPIDVHVGARVKLRRMMLSMSQEKLGEALGITFQQIQKYEKGTNRIGASRLMHIATILKVQPAFFFEDAPGTPQEAEESKTPATMQLLTQPFAMDILQALDRCDTAGKRLVLDVALKAAQPNQAAA
ncbi:helix-turn-helix transcriptional regulator [Labrenzia sp. DG1229]|uniref:helix-turn-helix domain-containing protein n=1 Tax=Labrenzia sp. DG1229 TaxID=681847 RepID=UPI00048CECF1|nr:helix-turn-helix transcriptional regulator [Labrenzia sp. DG1229]